MPLVPLSTSPPRRTNPNSSKKEIAIDDSMSLTSSEAEEWCASGEEPEALPSSQPSWPEPDSELIRVLSKGVEDLGLGSALGRLRMSRHGLLDEWFLPGRRQPPSRQRPAPFLPAVHEELTKTCRAPYSALVSSSSAALITVDGAEEKGYSKLPPLEEAVAAHLCLPSTLGLKAHAALPSKPCRTTSALANRAYAAAGQADMEESGQHQDAFKELRTATDLALRATKATAQAVGKTMASLVVLERHLWLNLTEIRDAEKMAFLDSPVSPKGLFGPAVDGLAQRFSEAQKTSQALRHFLPKRSGAAAASHQKAPPTQPAKPAPLQPQKSEPELQKGRGKGQFSPRPEIPQKQLAFTLHPSEHL